MKSANNQLYHYKKIFSVIIIKRFLLSNLMNPLRMKSRMNRSLCAVILYLEPFFSAVLEQSANLTAFSFIYEVRCMDPGPNNEANSFELESVSKSV